MVPEAEVLESLTVNPAVGLSTDEVTRRRKAAGANVLSESAAVPLWKKLLGQFSDLVIWILIFAALIAGVM
jgi:P-type Ca2+ transporter type 2C